jgi:hypothetical protein
VSVSVFVGIGAGLAVLGAILLLVAICLIVGAHKVSDASRYYQFYDHFLRKNVYCDNILNPPGTGSTPGIDLPEMYVF